MSDSKIGPREERLISAGRMAASLAHDWNNFLTILEAQAAELAESAPDHPGVRQAAGEMRGSIRMASDFPRRLLGWLGAEPGLRQRTNLNEILAASLPLLERSAGRGVRCSLALTPLVVEIDLDRSQCVNALLNLLSNAAHAMNGRGHVAIRTETNGISVRICVEDEGCGMPPDVLERVREPFFSTRAGNGGTGLGLYAVQRFANEHGGFLAIESTPGQGTRVAIELPYSTTTSNG